MLFLPAPVGDGYELYGHFPMIRRVAVKEELAFGMKWSRDRSVTGNPFLVVWLRNHRQFFFTVDHLPLVLSVTYGHRRRYIHKYWY